MNPERITERFSKKKRKNFEINNQSSLEALYKFITESQEYFTKRKMQDFLKQLFEKFLEGSLAQKLKKIRKNLQINCCRDFWKSSWRISDEIDGKMYERFSILQTPEKTESG